MNIRIIKNSQGLSCQTLNNGCVLQLKENDSVYGNIKQLNYYLYDLEKNESVEIEPTIKKYNLIEVKDIKFQSDFIYFSGLNESDSNVGKVIITVYRYNIISKESVAVYKFEEDLEKYDQYMRTKIFAVNEYYLFIQNEYLRANLTEDYEDYFDYEICMYSVKEDKIYKINDENLNHYGIIDFEPVTSNICVIKQGFNLLKDERYKILKKSEAAMESVSFVNIGQMVSDILLGQQNIVMDAIENVYYSATIPYMKVEHGYVIYSKVKLDENMEEEIIFYNFAKKEAFMCINGSIGETTKIVKTCVIDSKPYIILEKQNGYELIDIIEQKNTMILDRTDKIEYINNDIMIVSNETKGIFGRKKSYVVVYKLPRMKMVHREKGRFVAGTVLSGEQIYIMTGSNK